MAVIGKRNILRVDRIVDFGVYLDGGEQEDILLPARYVPAGCKVDDNIEVFIYLDSEDRIIATTEKPFGETGEFAMLNAVAINNIGAFLDWGLQKDILVPFREQKIKMEIGKNYLVYIYVDHLTNRIVASSKIDKFLDNTPPEYRDGQEVDLIIENETDIGFRAIVNNSHWGLLYKNEVFLPLKTGQHIKGYIRKVREDEKIDLTLNMPGYDQIDTISKSIMKLLKENNGFLSISDKSSAETIYNTFGISKKSFKKALGNLYKQRLIVIEAEGIRISD